MTAAVKKSKAECIRDGLSILLSYGEVEVDVDIHGDRLWAGSRSGDWGNSGEDGKTMGELGWFWDEAEDSWYIFT
jgi:hypothetical protein